MPTARIPDLVAHTNVAATLGQPASRLPLPDTTDLYRKSVVPQLDADKRALLGQFMTPTPIGRYMATLFDSLSPHMRVLDPGAGVGALTAAFAERLCEAGRTTSVDFVAYEVDSVLNGYLECTLEQVIDRCSHAEVRANTTLCNEDFVLTPPNPLDLFRNSNGDRFTHVIMNPPYRKISSTSTHRLALRHAGIETSNLYTGFMYLAAQALQIGGEMVAIVPRSFCNGPYFKSFRVRFFETMALRHVHVFEARDQAFRDDNVLQENIIVHAVKGVPTRHVRITASSDSTFDDLTERLVPHERLVHPNDTERFVHIAVNELEQNIADRLAAFSSTLDELGIQVSTGPVVDFRLRRYLRPDPVSSTVPVLYPTHFRGGSTSWPKHSRKPNSILVCPETRKWLWPNDGNYVVTRRFTSKEEPRRIVASTYGGDLPGELVGFENHLNVYHAKQRGITRPLAVGLSVYLNSTLVDRYFRQFNGHTQVNATDLRALRYPDADTLARIGQAVDGHQLSQNDIDNIIGAEVMRMPGKEDPLNAQGKIDEALEVLRALGLPPGQQNKRSALTLLALLDLKPSGSWSNIKQPLIGITPVMDYIRDHYGQQYAPNTRETIRRQTMHQFVEAGLAIYNPDDPKRPVNSPRACYQVSDEAAAAIQCYGTKTWDDALHVWLQEQPTLAARWARHREMQMIPVQINDRQLTYLTPGRHSELIRQIVDSFAPRFAPGAEVIYIGDTGTKTRYFEADRLASLGVTVDRHGKLPDVVLYSPTNNWLFLVESVTSHGPVDAKRHNELAALFETATPGLVYVTAFPSRTEMSRYLAEISWETEVWCADTPSHLIHFDGDQFLGPYPANEAASSRMD